MNYLFVILAFLFLSSCRVDDEATYSTMMSTHKSENPEDYISLPSESEIDQDLTAGSSYLVSFRSTGSQSLASMSQSMLTSSQQRLQERLIPELAVSSGRLLANLNLSRPGRSFVSQSQIPLPSSLSYLQGSLSTIDDMASIAKVNFLDHNVAKETLYRWYKEKLIWYAEPNYKVKLNGEKEDTIINNFNDASKYPWLDEVKFIDAISYLSTRSALDTPVVAVLDSGVDVMHPALVDSIYVNTTGQNKLCRDDIYGCDTTQPSKDFLGSGSVYPAGLDSFNQTCTSENCQHGTHVAGIIAGNDSAFTGLCPYCKVMVVKVVDVEIDASGVEQFQIEDAAIIAGLAYLSGFTVGDQPLVRVINASFGKFQKSRNVGLFIEALKNFGKGTLMVAAAGNEDTMKEQYPAAFDDVIAVANVDSNASQPKKAISSNFGMWVNISAPGSGSCELGGGILSSVPGGAISCQGGTSMSSPVVAAVAGLVLASEPDISYDELKERILSTASPEALYNDGVNDAYHPQVADQSSVPLLGRGLVNAWHAVDPSQDTTTAETWEQNQKAVKPGCGSIGLEAQGFWGSLILMILPLTLAFIRNQ